MYRPNSLWTWLFIIIALVQAAVILALESSVPSPLPCSGIATNSCKPNRYVFANFQIHLEAFAAGVSQSKTIPTFLSLYIFGFFYVLILAYDALRLKNTIQIIGLCLCNFGLLIYGAVQIDQIQDAVDQLRSHGALDDNLWGQTEPMLIAIPCILAVTSIMMMFVAWKLYDEFAWTIYKHISADLRMKRRYLTYQVSFMISYPLSSYND